MFKNLDTAVYFSSENRIFLFRALEHMPWATFQVALLKLSSSFDLQKALFSKN